MANRWGNNETVTGFIFLGSKITADGDCSHEIKRYLFHGRKAMINLDSISNTRDITLPKKICLVKTMVFPVVMYGCELNHKESFSAEKWMFLNCAVGEDYWESIGSQGEQASQSYRQSVLIIHWKD